MGKKASGLGAAKKLQKRRNKSRWHSKKFVRRILNLKKKSDPLRGASQAKRYCP